MVFRIHRVVETQLIPEHFITHKRSSTPISGHSEFTILPLSLVTTMSLWICIDISLSDMISVCDFVDFSFAYHNAVEVQPLL